MRIPDAPLTDVEVRVSWRDRALCHPANLPAGVTADDFFPGYGQTAGAMSRADRAGAARAAACCAQCPVRRPCAAFAAETPPITGVWAGTVSSVKSNARRVS